MPKIIKKLLYYRDFGLLIKILFSSFKLLSLCKFRGPEKVLALIPAVTNYSGNLNRAKIDKYLNLCLFIRRKLNLNEACFMESAITCYVLRKFGILAKINFGLKKDAKITPDLTGHCWVSVESEAAPAPYELVCSYP